MSLSLRLYMNAYERVSEEQNPLSGWETLSFHDNRDLFDAIRALPSEELPLGLSRLTEEEGWATTTTDAYGEPLRFVRARRFSTHLIVDDHALHPWDRAVLAFLCHLPPDTRVVLDWG